MNSFAKCEAHPQSFVLEAGGHRAASAIASLESGRRSFSWLNLSVSDISVRRLVDAVREHVGRVPRSGHLGNWGDPESAHSGSLDYNFVLCGQLAVGSPLIFDLNQTEQADLDGGDTIYLPGSDVAGGRRTPLDLYAFDGKTFSTASAAVPRFVPYVQTRDADGALIPLTAFHRRRLARLDRWQPEYQSSALLSDKDKARQILEVMVSRILRSDRAARLWETLSDRTVRKDGLVQRRRSFADKGWIQIGEERYTSASSVAERLLQPLEMASGIDLQNRLESAPSELPLLSNHATYGLLVLCRPDAGLFTGQPSSIAVHVQWGAIGLAGVPPVQKSYFEDNRKRVRSLFDLLGEESKFGSRGLFIVLPGPPFTLFPRADMPSDAAIVNDLASAVRSAFQRHKTSAADLLASSASLISRIVGDPARPRLSEYFSMRFRRFRSQLHGQGALPVAGVTLCDGVQELSLTEASLLTGVLWKHFSNGEGTRE